MEVGQIVVQEAAQRAGYGGVVDHDVKPAQAGDGSLDQRGDLLRIGHVDQVKPRAGAQCASQLRAVAVTDVGDDHRSAPLVQRFDGRSPDTGRSAGNDRYLAFELVVFHHAHSTSLEWRRELGRNRHGTVMFESHTLIP